MLGRQHVSWVQFLKSSQIGAALVSRDGKLLGRGHNMRVQKGSAIHHVSLVASEGKAVN